MTAPRAKCIACKGIGQQLYPARNGREFWATCRICNGRGTVALVTDAQYRLEAAGWLRPDDVAALKARAA
jgi:hypothetical protein